MSNMHYKTAIKFEMKINKSTYNKMNPTHIRILLNIYNIPVLISQRNMVSFINILYVLYNSDSKETL